MTDPVAIARNLAPGLAERAGEFEAARRMPADVARQLAEAGLFRLCLPKYLGGLEASPRVIVETIEALATGDGSAGWCLMIGGTTGLVSAYLDKETAREVYGDPLTITGGVFAPRGKAKRDGDDYIVNGRWQWGSGSQNCSYLMGGCLCEGPDGAELLPNGLPNPRMMIVPMSEATILDTWHVSGLKGTGSHDFEIKGARVPRRRSVALVTDKPVADAPLYAFPIFGLLALGVSAVALGIGRGALNEVMGLSATRVPQGSRKVAAERPAVQADVARAEAEILAGRAFLLAAIEEAEHAVNASGAIPIPVRARLRLAATHGVTAAVRATDIAYTLGGGSAVYETSPLQRRLRDVHVATQHMMVADATRELTGRVLLGLETDASTL